MVYNPWAILIFAGKVMKKKRNNQTFLMFFQ